MGVLESPEKVLDFFCQWKSGNPAYYPAALQFTCVSVCMSACVCLSVYVSVCSCMSVCIDRWCWLTGRAAAVVRLSSSCRTVSRRAVWWVCCRQSCQLCHSATRRNVTARPVSLLSLMSTPSPARPRTSSGSSHSSLQLSLLVQVFSWRFGLVGNVVGHINEVSQRRARLVLG